jgi:hypothetical protein
MATVEDGDCIASIAEKLGKERKWAAYSQAWTKGKLKGQTGVVFQPSRMGGDDYTLTVYVAFDRKAKDTITLDDKAQPLVAADVMMIMEIPTISRRS